MTLYEFRMLNDDEPLKTIWHLPDTEHFIYIWLLC